MSLSWKQSQILENDFRMMQVKELDSIYDTQE